MVKIDNLRFFQPTPEFRKMMILEALKERPELSQKELSNIAGIVPSLVNKYINELKKEGYIKTEALGRSVRYNLTNEGLSELYYLRLSFFNDIVSLSRKIEASLENIFLKLKGKNYIGIYGAGLVGKVLAELLLNKDYNVVVFFDDDQSKIGTRIYGIPVVSISSKVNIDALIIASVKNSKKMIENAKKHNFFDLYVFRTEDFRLSWHG